MNHPVYRRSGMSRLCVLALSLSACGHASAAPAAPTSPVATSRCPALAGAYPTRIATASDAERAAKQAAFRAHNPGSWPYVSIDFDGGALVISSADPALVDPSLDHLGEASPRERAAWLALVERQLAAAHAEQIGVSLDELHGNGTTWYIATRDDEAAFGSIRFDKSSWIPDGGGPRRPLFTVRHHLVRSAAVPPRKVSDQKILAPLLGRRYVEYTPGRPGPMYDPPSSRPPQEPCRNDPAGLRPECPHTVELSLTAVSVTLEEHVACVQTTSTEEVRRLVRVRWNAPSGSNPRFTPLDGAPQLPLEVDAVTGEVLPATSYVAECR
jgi:hypothetical protein